ncbi:hypothetical protein PC114_g26728 [Phytophthora cactorum]|nr:hypothetical protein PC114_g26728 [Phytophthora cactorum]
MDSISQFESSRARFLSCGSRSRFTGKTEAIPLLSEKMQNLILAAKSQRTDEAMMKVLHKLFEGKRRSIAPISIFLSRSNAAQQHIRN